MPAVALAEGVSSVTCTDGAKGDSCEKDKWNWNSPTTQSSDAGSSTVKINGKGVVCAGHAMASHPDGDPCVAAPVDHAPTLSSYSSSVKIEGKGVGRVGDTYNSDGHYSHTITSGSPNVTCG